MSSVRSAIENTVSISLFNRGLAGKIFADVRRTGAKVVMKNNTPECVLISPEEYVRLTDQVNDAKLLLLAEERMKKYDPADAISYGDMNRRLGITEDELSDFNEVDLE